ncbi:hypothetical protein C8Q74DRAFT_1243797 [Fomes fomentarius]|nr:hypothetical protein C8Q74DRAFT_1243797 [Fomes fomentarius]
MSCLSVCPKLVLRDSIFPGLPNLHRTVDTAGYATLCGPYLRKCVMTMEVCCDEELLQQGTYDLPHMMKVLVLESEWVSLLVDGGQIRRYKVDPGDKIEP